MIHDNDWNVRVHIHIHIMKASRLFLRPILSKFPSLNLESTKTLRYTEALKLQISNLGTHSKAGEEQSFWSVRHFICKFNGVGYD